MSDLISRSTMIEQIERRKSLMVGDKTVGVDHILKFVENRPTVTDEEFKAEAKRRGYNLIKIPEKVKLLPCVCGRKRLQQMWCTYNWSYFRCPKCMIYSEKGKNDRQAKLNWNRMIEEKKNEASKSISD